MILIDISQIVISNCAMFTKNYEGELTTDVIRPMVLGSIKNYKNNFTKDFGNVVIACDTKSSCNWRKTKFQFYKAHRAANRDELLWDKIYEIMSQLIEEFKEYLPYKVIQVNECEGDDVIAILCKNIVDENHMIISADGDFAQLQLLGNVKQYSPIKKEFVNVINPLKDLYTKVLSGDKSDGIPNILSDSDSIINADKRQRPLNKILLAEMVESLVTQSENEYHIIIRENFENFNRNNMLVNFQNIPQQIQENIMEYFSSTKINSKKKLEKYFIDKKLKTLYNQIQQF